MTFEIFIDRPVFTSVLSVLLVLFGAVALRLLPVRETPPVQSPVVTVSTTWFGADPALMESDVTEVLERQINGIEGIRTITSTSSEQQSTVTVEFVVGHDLDEAANDVRSRVSRARRALPPDVEDPVVEKADADAQPVVFLRIDAAGRDLIELTELADTLVRERVQNVAGVSSVQIFGEQVPAIRVELDPVRMTARSVTIADVELALANDHVNVPAGRVEGAATELSVRFEGDLRTVEAFEQLVVARQGPRLVRLGDVADVRPGAENERTAARSDGNPTVTIAVLPQADGNILEISDEIGRRLPRIQEDLPEGVNVVVGYDRSIPVRASIREVVETLAVAVVLVLFVILAFLRSVRSTFVPAIAIPVSLFGTLPVLWLAGFSINVFTLFGLVLAIGLVVDDAIVVLENATRRAELGDGPHEAAVRGTREIAFAVIATTLALVAVFAPVVFTGGVTGRLFVEFGVTVGASVLVSMFVALTLTPMLCARVLVATDHGPPRWLAGLERGFGWTLGLGVRWPVLPLFAAVMIAVIGAFASTRVPREFFPLEDRNLVIVRALAPEGTSFPYMDARMKELEAELMAAAPERVSVLTRVGMGPGNAAGAGNTGMYIMPLVPKGDRSRSQAEIAGDVRRVVGPVTAFLAIPIQPATVGRGFGSPFQFVLQHADFEVLARELPKFAAAMREIPGLTAVNADLKLDRPEVVFTVDREHANLVDVPLRDIARALQVLAGGREIAEFKRGTRRYPVIAQLLADRRDTPSDLLDLRVRSRRGGMIPLADLVDATEHAAAASRFHYDRSPSATVSANLEGIAIGDAIASVRDIADRTLPAGFRTALAGESKDFEESSASLSFVLLLSLVVVYLVLAAQFDSVTDPIAVLVSVPLAIAAAFVALWATGTTLSFFSQVGLVLLVGLVTKNGILIVEVARQLRASEPAGDLWEIAARAARQRFRPIVMTSLATIGGALPIAVGFTSESRAPLGVVVVGGMLVATVMSLYVTPVLWAAISRVARR